MAQPPSLDDDIPATAVAVADSGPKSQASLDELIAKATARYAVKDYSASAEFYSRATELQAELNGEMSTQNADLLYLYGRCLYQVAVQNSDVLGSKITGEEQSKQKLPEMSSSKGNTSDTTKTEGASSERDLQTGHKGREKEESTAAESTAKPYFNITGDENWDESDDELMGEGNTGEAEEDAEDDFSNAFEVLDIARVLLEKRLDEVYKTKTRQEEEQKPADLGRTVLEMKKLKEKLADTRDLQAEISLEAERFADAAADLQVALDIKSDLFPLESSMVAEAHYKLSLALEFSAITPMVDADGQIQPGTVGEVDQTLRDSAARHMAMAIESCKARITIEKKLLSSAEPGEYVKTTTNGDGSKQVKITLQSVKEVEEMVTDMEQRLKELQEAPVSVTQATNVPDSNQLGGILGSLLGTSADDQRSRLEEAMGKANDLTNLIKKKKPKQGEKRKPDESRDSSKADEKRARHAGPDE